MKESTSSSRSCESHRRRGRAQSTRGIRKRCRIRAGWRHEWIPRTELPSRSVLAIREVVRGPFSSPRLVGASPYVLISSKCKNKERWACESAERCPRIKRGIPDPWAEYLAYRGFCSSDYRRIVRRDIELGCKNIYVTATVWKNLGLPLGQGIPDPWKIPTRGKKWVSEKRVTGHDDRRHPREKRRGHCKPSPATPPVISDPRSRSRIKETGVNANPVPCQEARCVEVSQQERGANFEAKARCSASSYRALEGTVECTAPCNTRRNDPTIPKPPIFPTPRRPSEQQGTEIHQVPESELYRERQMVPEDRHTPKKLVPLDCATQTLTFDVSRKFKVQDVACMCEGSDFRKRRVCFGTGNFSCTDHGGQSLNQNLNVTQLPCGCVHISPCSGMLGCLGSRNECQCSELGNRGGITFSGDAPHRESLDQRHRGYQQPEDTLSEDPKPKKVSKMKRLLSSWKKASKSRDRTGEEQKAKSDDRVNGIPDDSKLVCCRCSCPYLKIKHPHATSSKSLEKKKKKKIENPSHVTSSKSVETKKKKCACVRCIAKRERRERRRIKKALLKGQETLVSPKSCRRCVQDESPNHRMRECPADVQVPKYEAVVTREEENCPPTAPLEDSRMKEDFETVKNVSGNVNSADTWKSPAVFGASWYSSDSGENADVSEVSRHNLQCSGMLQARPETSVVTSCTFISRINHSSILQCLKKRERRPSKKESVREELDADGTVGRNYFPRPVPGKNSSSYKTDCKTNENQIPLLSIEESEVNDSQASPRPACIDPRMGFTSFSKDEETSQSSSSTSRDTKRGKSLSKRTSSGRGMIADEPIRSRVDRDSIKGIKQPGDSQRSHLITPRTETIHESESTTDVVTEKAKVPDAGRKIQKAGYELKPEDLRSSSKSTRPSCDGGSNFKSDPTITTIVSPRRISTDSCTVCSQDSCSRKCQSYRAPANSVDGNLSEEPRSMIGKQDAIVHRCEVPLTPGPYFAKTNSSRSNKTKDSRDSTPRFETGSPAKVDEFLESSCAVNIAQETENPGPQKFDEEVRILLPRETYQGGRSGSADNKCYLKYCSLRNSGPCVVSPSNKIPRIQDSRLGNKNGDNTPGKQFPLGRRSFSSSSNQRNPPLLGNAFSYASQHPVSKLQDKLDIG